MAKGLPEDKKFDMKQYNIIQFSFNLEEADNKHYCDNTARSIPIVHGGSGVIPRVSIFLFEPNL